MSDEKIEFNHSDQNPGEVVTFYSFKGGVGRTMALSNIAFLAANSGLKVLIMDWDLEAPGLAYYFRGIVDPTTLGKAKESRGVLHILWNWVNKIHEANTKDAFERTAANFNNGKVFEACRVRLLDDRHLNSGGCLDHIGTGSSANIQTPDPTTYENALAKFPWHDFFAKLGGGFVIESLRRWAKERYDLVLIDSRTGLAEAAGVCTMQLADRVAMCFVMNRQNIDGIARVSGAIRQMRGDEVALFAVPMRVAREGTAEESEARARATAELSKVGGFSLDELQHQLQALAIKQAENVPFYETISQVTAEDPELDPLTFNYARLAKELLGRQLAIYPIDEEWLKVIRARLKPGFATKEFVEKLSDAEPLRGIEELNRLLVGAQEHASEDNELDKEYVNALVMASLAFSNNQYLMESHALRDSCLDLLRMLCRKDPSWRELLIVTIDQHLATSPSILEDDEELALVEELDALLALDASIEARLRRIGLKRRSAQLSAQLDDLELALHENAEGASQLVDIHLSPLRLSPEQSNLIYILEIELSLQRGIFLERTDAKEEALDAFLECLTVATQDTEVSNLLDGSIEVTSILTEAHARIALLESDRNPLEVRCKHAVESARNPNAAFLSSKFFELADVLKLDPAGPEQLFAFLELTVDPDLGGRPGSLILQFSRTLRSVTIFIEFIDRFIQEFGPMLERRPLNISHRLLDTLSSSLTQVSRRVPMSVSRLIRSPSLIRELIDAFFHLKNNLALTNINWAAAKNSDDVVRGFQEQLANLPFGKK